MIKQLLFIAIAFVALVACNDTEEVSTDMLHFPGSAGESDSKGRFPEITFEEELFDFGSIAEGELVKHTFKFKNTGKAPLILSKVEPSCGCTAMRGWPKEPIPPGKGGEISIEFDSTKRPGFQKKSITVLANTVPARNVVHFQGEVIGPK